MDAYKSSATQKKQIDTIYTHVYLADILTTNLTKITVIWVKVRHKAGFLGPIGSKITPTKEKERRRERARKKKGGEAKKAMVALLAL